VSGGGGGDPGPHQEPEGSGEDAGLIAEDMMAGFRRASGGVSARFSASQAGIVRMLVGQVAELVGGPDLDSAQAAGPVPDTPEQAETGARAPVGPGGLEALLGLGPSELPEDPVLARLLPDAYRDDAEAAGDFRRYTEQSLRSGKVAAAQTVLGTLPREGGKVRLSGEDAQVWLRALNDVRLALGVRLGITEDYERELAGVSGEDPRLAYLQVYDWLTFLQETLVRALW
jgi:Domain of unknown function (DUF2017)